MKLRQDAWTEENDLLLAETVLRHVREGSTQLNAFEEVGDILDRTSAACGFRWNAVVRHQYSKALTLARKHRKQRQRMLGTGKKNLYQPPTLADFESMAIGLENHAMELTGKEFAAPSHSMETLTESAATSSPQEELDLNTVISFLRNYSGNDTALYTLRAENDRLRMEVQELSRKNLRLEETIHDLEQKLNKAESNSTTIQEDYETLINIMNKARKLAMIDEEDRTASAFKMDRNGNLEKLAE